MFQVAKELSKSWRTVLTYLILSVSFGFIDLPVDKFDLAFNWQFYVILPFQVANVVWILLTLGAVSSIYNQLYYGKKRSRVILLELFLLALFCFISALSTSAINRPPLTPNESVLFIILALRIFTANRHREATSIRKEEVR